MYAFILTRSRLELLIVIFFAFFCNRIMAFDLCHNFVSTQFLDNIDRNSPKFKNAFILRRSRFGLSPVIFLQICNRVMTLDLC